MIYLYLWLLGASAMIAFIIATDRTLTRSDAVAVFIVNAAIWPVLFVVFALTALGDLWQLVRRQEFARSWRDWWNQPLRKTRGE